MSERTAMTASIDPTGVHGWDHPGYQQCRKDRRELSDIVTERGKRIAALEAEVERLSVARIALTRDLFATVDADDVPLVTAYKWHAVKGGDGLWYAVGRKKLYMHHLFIPKEEGFVVDHINGDGLDNRRSNLQLISQAQNISKARYTPRTDKTAPFRGGVSLHYTNNGVSRPWAAQISVRGKKTFLGYYASPEEAARAYDQAALDLRGSCARLNFPDEHEEEIAS